MTRHEGFCGMTHVFEQPEVSGEYVVVDGMNDDSGTTFLLMERLDNPKAPKIVTNDLFDVLDPDFAETSFANWVRHWGCN